MRICAVHHRGRRRGITLLEVLVVVGVLAVLIGILAPAVTVVRGQSQLATCGGNLRQIHAAIVLYTQDFNDTLPTASNYEETYSRWGGKAGSYKTTAWTHRLINQYVKRTDFTSTDDTSAGARIFRCPADNGGRAGDWAQNRYPTEFDFWGTSYFYNSSANNNDGALGLQGKRIGQITHPSKVVLVSDWPFNVHFQNSANFSYMYWHNQREQGWGNVMFLDGHVAYLHATQDSPNFQNGADWTFIFSGG